MPDDEGRQGPIPWPEELLNARVNFWMCPDPSHRDRRDAKGWPEVEVEWRDDVAYCTYPGCTHSSLERRLKADYRDFTYDRKTGAAYFKFSPFPDGATITTTALAADIHVDRLADGTLVGIEFLGMPEPGELQPIKLLVDELIGFWHTREFNAALDEYVRHLIARWMKLGVFTPRVVVTPPCTCGHSFEKHPLLRLREHPTRCHESQCPCLLYYPDSESVLKRWRR